jgi:hypothetical protein
MDQKRERKIWAAEIRRVSVGSPAQKTFKDCNTLIFFFDSSLLLFASRVQLEVI